LAFLDCVRKNGSTAALDESFFPAAHLSALEIHKVFLRSEMRHPNKNLSPIALAEPFLRTRKDFETRNRTNDWNYGVIRV